MPHDAGALDAQKRRAAVRVGAHLALEIREPALERQRAQLGDRGLHHDVLERLEQHLGGALDGLQTHVAGEPVANEHVEVGRQHIAPLGVAGEVGQLLAHQLVRLLRELGALLLLLADIEQRGARLLDAVKAEFEVKTAPVCDADWENNWKEYYKPLEIGEKLLVVPEWIDCAEVGRVPLRLDPGLLFGTGAHATTRMCLAALEKYAGEGKRALDLGCGSGILGIGAIVLGSDFCTACDIDPKAPDTVMENAALNDIGGDKMKVYASDIDTEVLEKARNGVYRQDELKTLSPQQLQRYFMRGTGPHEGLVRVRQELANCVEFAPVNLLDKQYNVPGPFDAIFCRNVMIYFDKTTQQDILRRFVPLLKPDGLLFAGHSENFSNLAREFSLRGQTVYALSKEKA